MANICFVLPLLLAGTLWLYILTLMAPNSTNSENTGLSFPSSLSELQQLATVTHKYYQENWLYVLTMFSSAYIYKQTFAIPGTVFLNLLGGAIFGVVIGFPLCCFLAASGASCCFLLSSFCGRDIVKKYFPTQLKNFQDKVQKNSHQLIYYLLFLRMFPMSPNWLINVIAPLVGIPLPMFFFTVLVGLAPYVFLCTQAGVVLTSLTSLDELFTMKVMAQMALLALAALAPTFLFRRKRQSIS